jgi:hypothetical protein
MVNTRLSCTHWIHKLWTHVCGSWSAYKASCVFFSLCFFPPLIWNFTQSRPLHCVHIQQERKGLLCVFHAVFEHSTEASSKDRSIITKMVRYHWNVWNVLKSQPKCKGLVWLYCAPKAVLYTSFLNKMVVKRGNVKACFWNFKLVDSWNEIVKACFVRLVHHWK